MAAAGVPLPAISAFAYVKVGRISLPVATAQHVGLRRAGERRRRQQDEEGGGGRHGERGQGRAELSRPNLKGRGC